MDAADDLVQNKLTPQKITPRKTTYLACPSASRARGREALGRAPGPTPRSMRPAAPSRPAPAPPMPALFGSHRKPWNENLRARVAAVDAADDGDRAQDTASKIWEKIRRGSGFGTLHGHPSPQRDPSTSSMAPSVSASVSLPLSATCGSDGRALRRKKATDGLGINGSGTSPMRYKNSIPTMSSRTSLVDRTNLGVGITEDGVTLIGKRRSSKASARERKGSGRWGFTNWWLNN